MYICEVTAVNEASCSFENCTDAVLVGFIKSGGTLADEAFENMCARYMGLISAVAGKFRDCLQIYDRNDIMQEGLIGLMFACRTFDVNGGMSFRNYAVRCVENRLHTIRRHVAAKSRVPDSNIEPIDSTQDEVEDITSMSMQETLEVKEFLNSVYSKIDEILSPLEKSVLSLHLSGYSYKESADLLSLSEKTVDNALYRIRKKLSNNR